jgi:hypothetical protein
MLAQRTWLDADDQRSLSVIATLGIFDDGVTGTPVGTFAVRSRHGIGDGLAVVTELPVAHARQEGGLSGSAVGLPWIGLEHHTDGARFELGARIAFWSPRSQASALAWAYGALLDFDRREAWFARASSVRFAAQVGEMPEDGTFASAKLGVTGIVAQGSGGDGELFADYQARAGIVRPRWAAWVGVIGTGIVTEREGGFGERTLHQLELAGRFRAAGAEWEGALRRYVGEAFASSVPVILRLGVRALL